MDYKEKYEKALEFATAIYRDGNYTVLKTITTTFPELEDIRNEKIRHALIRLVKQSTEELDESTQEEMLDWLEKQCKQEPYDQRKKKELKKIEPKALNSNKANEAISQYIEKFKKDFEV